MADAVQGGTLRQWPPQGLDDGPEVALGERLAVAGARRPGDVLVDERSSEVVATGLEQLAGPGGAHLHPGRLGVVDVPRVADRGHPGGRQRLREGRTPAARRLTEDGGA